jgi:putative ABC transport system ATP-binding protein
VGVSGKSAVLLRAVTGQRRWRYVAAASALGAAHQAGEALVPVLIGVLIDEAVTTGDRDALLRWISVLAAVFVGLSLSFRFSLRASERAAELAAHAVRTEITVRVLDDRGGAEAGRLSGDLATVATADAERVGGINLAVPVAVSAVAALLAGAVALLRVSVPLGLLVLAAAPLLLWLAHLAGKPLERRSDTEQERAAHASGVAADLVAGLRAVKGIGAEDAAADRYRITSRDSMGAAIRAARAQAWLDGFMLAVTGLFLALIALVGGRLAAQGDITIGELVAAVGLAQFLLWPLSIFSWVNGLFAQGRASAARVAAVLTAPPAVPPVAPAEAARLPQPVLGRISLRDVASGPLRGVTLEVDPGELVGIVATDPADATALLRCLSRDADPESGTVELDGVSLDTLDPGAVRGAILVAAHDADLFEGSLIGNVAAASGGPTAVQRALVAAGADEVARALPDGADTVISERGRSLSGGQRQRVALARALAADPPVLVVHDPTTAVDAVTEAGVAAGIRDLRRGRTTVVVATSPALLARTDRVVVLDAGVVVAQGRHADLLREHAGYRTAVLA